MRRILFFFVCVIFAAINVNAQQVYGLTSIAKNGTSFEVRAGDLVLPVNPYLYKRIKKAPESYALVVYNGTNGSMITVAHRGNINYAVLAVDSIGYNEEADVAEVYLSDKTVYKSTNDEWLKVLKGQHVERWFIDGETKTLEHIRTVPRDVELTNAVPYVTVPGAAQQAQVQVPTANPTKDVAQVTAQGNNAQTRPAIISR